jgi:flavorubredoxin
MRQLKPNIYFVGAIDWDRRLFDELIPLPDGTSYNAYLIRGNDINLISLSLRGLRSRPWQSQCCPT